MPHGVQDSVELQISSAAGPLDGYRNLFGPIKSEDDVYQGYGLKTPEGVLKTTHLLESLARGMDPRNDNDAGAENPDIPSGYTYLLQLVAHDLTFAAAGAPLLSNRQLNPVNSRHLALSLETIYGGSSLERPLSYCPAETKARARYQLRLGVVKEEGTDPAHPTDSAGRPTNPARIVQLTRDLPRIECPHLNDRGYEANALTEVLISDPRNDDHAVLSQLTVLFHLLHNAVCTELRKRIPGVAGDDWEYDLFLQARSVVTHVYRTIIKNDLMSRVLSKAVYDHYTQSDDSFLDKSGGAGIPVEFSHGAFRFGHAMVRNGYTFNQAAAAAGRVQDLVRVLFQTSAGKPKMMPLSWDWLIQWPLFFKIGSGEPNLSRRIRPEFPGAFFKSPDEIPVGHLAKSDLLRGVTAGVRTVKSLVREIQAAAPDFNDGGPVVTEDGTQPRLWINPLRPGIIRRELSNRGIDLSQEDRDMVAENPPLLWFVLLEAQHDEGGSRLGTIGSIVVAEVIFRALASSDDLATGTRCWSNGACSVWAEGQAKEAANQIIGNISSMPEMIGWLNGYYKYAPELPRFI